MAITPWAWLVVSLAAWRAAMAVAVDDVGRPMREWLSVRLPPRTVPLRGLDGHPLEGTGTLKPRWLVTFVECPWCVGVWTAGAGALLAHAAGWCDPWAWVAGTWLSAAALGGLLSDVSDWLSR